MFKNLKKFKNKTAIITEKNNYFSYTNIIEETDKVLKEIDSKKNLIFLIAKNNLETLIGYLSFTESANVVALIDDRTNIDLLEKLILLYKPDYIYCDSKKKLNVKYKLINSYYNFHILKSKDAVKKNMYDQLALLISTSGSTGSAKFVRQSNVNIESNIKSIINFLPIDSNDVTITTLPFSYVYGLSIINTHLKKGAAVVLNEKSMIDKSFKKTFIKHNVNNFGGVPYSYKIMNRVFNDSTFFNKLKYSTHAGGKMNLELLKDIVSLYKKNKTKFYSMYGSAEATARMAYLDWKFAEKKMGSIGKAIPGGKFTIEDTKGKEIDKHGNQGELIYRGKNVCLGYAEKISDLTKGDTNKGILRTGDIGFKDIDGFYFLSGRKDRFVKIHGQRINLIELEEIILNYGIESLCQTNEENKIHIFTKKYDKFKELINHLSIKTSIHPSVFSISSINKLPINLNFKPKLKLN